MSLSTLTRGAIDGKSSQVSAEGSEARATQTAKAFLFRSGEGEESEEHQASVDRESLLEDESLSESDESASTCLDRSIDIEMYLGWGA